VVRKKGDKDYSKSEKQLLISLINDYQIFGATDHEIIQMLSEKIGKKISETLFYRFVLLFTPLICLFHIPNV
jgi:hypothetical protein